MWFNYCGSPGRNTRKGVFFTSQGITFQHRNALAFYFMVYLSRKEFSEMALQCRWHTICLQCPQCSLDFAITTLSVASDGAVLIEGVCVKCGVQLNWKSDLIKLIRKSVVMDIEESKVSIPNQPLKPPLLLSRPAEHLTDEDLKWEHELGIKPEDLEQ